ncbi:VOC family protein [Salinicoccus sp. ID82-1]|uniref:VOC family protein n=1 Tax=Salinicoccus sp. ID82-1 TaxID=2820269 RepID=UPI001F163CE3|nr:VOC family protein [Salinicoccus sp. ID82-1]MCG1010367.1 VOC family protein [Salinicoccus sp. ID82-1]
MNRINLVTLGVRDISASLDFYRNIGFKAHIVGDEAHPTVVFFSNEGSKLSLYPIQELAADINRDNPPEVSKGGFNGVTLAYNGKSEAEVDDIMDRVVQHGATVVKTPQPLSWGGYGGYFTDIDGYYWEVAYGAEWEFDASNMLVLD